MNKNTISTLLLFSKIAAVPGLPPAPPEPKIPNLYPASRLWNAVRKVESNDGKFLKGDFDKKNKVYRAWGPYQIHRNFALDSGLITGKEQDWTQAPMDEQRARQAVRAYAKRYAKISDREDAPLTLEQMERAARIHNGGPSGASNPDTLKYWNKVKKAMFGR